MDNLEKLTTQGTQDEKEKKKKKSYLLVDDFPKYLFWKLCVHQKYIEVLDNCIFEVH